MDTVGYRVGNNFFYNVYLAIRDSMNSGQKLEFYCYNQLYGTYDWTVEPEKNFDDLMSERAFELRNQYERLILLWSGGTDSHTIYNVFAKNRIHIDEIIVKTSDRLPWYPESYVEWLHKNHWDPHTVITSFDQYDSNIRIFDVPDDDWVWKNKGDLLMFGMNTNADGVKHLVDKNHGGLNYRLIAGYEKTKLVYRNGRWYARQIDIPLQTTMGYDDYLERFFLHPKLIIKQSHIAKHSIKKYIQKNNITLHNGDWGEAKWPKTAEGYRDWARSLGLSDELTDGLSFLQKNRSDNLRSIDITSQTSYTHLDIGSKIFNDLLTVSDPAVLNYAKGLFNLTSDRKFFEYLNNNYLREKNQVVNIIPIFSPEYDLGE